MNLREQRVHSKLSKEINDFIHQRKTLQLASTNSEGHPHASYAPYAIGDDCFYVLLSDIAIHGKNLKTNKLASVLIIEDEDSAAERFARIRVNYNVSVTCIDIEASEWQQGVQLLTERHGQQVVHLSNMSDFNIYRLTPTGGRYVKGFGQAYALAGESLSAEAMNHLTDGHKRRAS